MSLPEVGQKFGRLTIAEPSCMVGKYRKVQCVCDCGRSKLFDWRSVQLGLSKSCGCLSSEVTGQRSTTHGLRASKVYAVWNVMVQRCENPRNRQYGDYGGRGIRVSEAWLKFENFYADMGEPNGLTLERLDNAKGYGKSNCVWATRRAQVLNRRNTRKVTIGGVTYSVADIYSKLNLSYGMVMQRISTYGQTELEAVTGQRGIYADAAAIHLAKLLTERN